MKKDDIIALIGAVVIFAFAFGLALLVYPYVFGEPL